MVEGVDEGNIIRTANGVVPEGKTRETMTAIEVENAIQEPFFATMAGVLRQVEEGDEGRVQVHASGRDSWGSRPLRDDERTLKDDMDVEEVMRLGRALEGLPIRPLVRFDGGLYHVMRLTRMGEEDRKPVGTQKRIGLDLIQYFKGGAVRMAVRKI